ncbi:hypothetical protein ACI65C_012055 [Semiaphis heraclei]
MEDHTYSSYSLTSRPASAGLDADDSTSSINNLDDSTSFNTNNLFGNFEKENEYENIYSDCDDSIKDPDYVPPFQTLDVSCTGQNFYEDFNDTLNCLNDDQDISVPNVDEDFPVEGEIAGMRKRRMTGNEKHIRNIKLSEIKNQNQMDKHPLILKTCTEGRLMLMKITVLKKTKSRLYTLTHPEFKIEIAICKSTFLQTLGYTNDSVVTELVAVMEKDLCGKFIKENRVRHAPAHIIHSSAPAKRLNKPKADDCEDCEILNQDITNPESNSTLVIHKIKANKANAEYKKDSQEQEIGSTRYFSMDLQKVILIPYMPNIKSSYFLSRLVVFNETFATIKKGSTFNSYCVLWHEALSGRKAECITDSIMTVINKQRNVLKFVFWADNCTAQNKNWTLYLALVTAVNQIDGPNEIIIKYLTKGHTHMSADGIHGNIESKMRRKGSNCLEYKNDFDVDLIKLDFLKKSTLRNINCLPNHEDSQRGINSSKKKEIIKTLVPLMPENRRHFWQDLPESNNVTDLLHDEDYGLSNSLVI